MKLENFGRLFLRGTFTVPPNLHQRSVPRRSYRYCFRSLVLVTIGVTIGHNRLQTVW